jgi:hypothetical protein
MPDTVITTNLTNFLYAIIIAAVFCIFCTIGVQSKTALEALIGEYSVIGAALLLILVLKTVNINASEQLLSLSTLFTLGPFLLILFIIIYYIVIINIYFDKIVSNKISDYYFSFSNISTVLIMAQIFLLVSTIAKTTELPRKTFSILMLLGTINAIVVITLGIVLKFYTTDC